MPSLFRNGLLDYSKETQPSYCLHQLKYLLSSWFLETKSRQTGYSLKIDAILNGWTNQSPIRTWKYDIAIQIKHDIYKTKTKLKYLAPISYDLKFSNS